MELPYISRFSDRSNCDGEIDLVSWAQFIGCQSEQRIARLCAMNTVVYYGKEGLGISCEM